MASLNSRWFEELFICNAFLNDEVEIRG